MIKFINLIQDEPYRIFKTKYEEALNANQKNIDAISISSYNKSLEEVSSRFVNLKFVEKEKFIFFSNYNSPKSNDFESHKQIAALFYWPKINLQIRLKGIIQRTSTEYNNAYFMTRSKEKNALAISSNQSQPTSSFENIIEKYRIVHSNDNLISCPEYWGGFSFTPYEMEFWEGNDFRINKRNLFKKDKTRWKHFILEP
jgi:pyridoxamine 5'-phosphate oxidase